MSYRLVTAAAVLSLLLSACGGGSGGSGGAGNQAPIFTTSLPPNPVFGAWEDLEIWVEANDPEGDPVTIVLLNPPVSSEFAPLRGAPSPGRAWLHWSTSPQGGGLRELLFHVADNQGNAAIHRVQIEIHGAWYDRSHLVDVTGDGLLDLVVSAVNADVGGVVDAGAAYVWAGATAPTAAPTATLTVPGAAQDDWLGETSAGVAMFACRDVTGDGVADVVLGAPLADEGGITDQGAVYVWAGGVGLQGQVTPTARCAGTGITAAAALGLTSNRPSMMLWEVTGDGIPDIVVRAPNAFLGGLPGAGAVYVWRGGPTLVGAQAPYATMTDPSAITGDGLSDSHLLLTDVTGDSTPELLCHSTLVDVNGKPDVGAIHVFRTGATLVGAVAPMARLSVFTGAFDNSQIGGSAPLLVADVTQDSIPDVIATSPFADVGGVTDIGEVYVWAGAANLSGDVEPTARLSVAGAGQYAHLGTGGPGLLVTDVTGDSALDIVVPAPGATISGVDGAGAIYVWAGQAGLSGTPPPLASLTVPGATAGDGLGFGIYCWDVTGDDVQDVVASPYTADVGAAQDAGEAYVWAGGPGLTGTPALRARLTPPGASTNDRMGAWSITRDVTGDDTADLIVGNSTADVGGVVDAGAYHVWAGGLGLTGTPPPTATLQRPAPVAGDQLGWGGAIPMRIADVTGDNTNDIVFKAVNADVGGVVDAGGVWIWAGGATLTGTPAPHAVLSVPGATAGDGLGGAFDWFCTSMLCADVTNDGLLDLIIDSRYEDVGGVVDAGSVRIWAGGAGMVGTPAPYATLTVAGATAGDQLGSAFGNALHACDITGDGRLDIVAVTCRATIGGVAQTGAAYVWSGGPQLGGTPAPSSTLTVPGAVAGDALGGWPRTPQWP